MNDISVYPVLLVFFLQICPTECISICRSAYGTIFPSIYQYWLTVAATVFLLYSLFKIMSEKWRAIYPGCNELIVGELVMKTCARFACIACDGHVLWPWWLKNLQEIWGPSHYNDTVLPVLGFWLKERWLWDHLIFIMEFPIPGKKYWYWEGPCFLLFIPVFMSLNLFFLVLCRWAPYNTVTSLELVGISNHRQLNSRF